MTKTPPEPGDPISFKLATKLNSLRERREAETGSDPSLCLKNHRQGCAHDSGTLEIDEEAHTVTCSKCGRVIDPWEALIAVASKERRLQIQYEAIMQERKYQRGFYEKKSTLKARRCKHRHTHPTANGQVKCLSCDAILDRTPLKLTPPTEAAPRYP